MSLTAETVTRSPSKEQSKISLSFSNRKSGGGGKKEREGEGGEHMEKKLE